jgi:hypothetical protein
MTSFFREHLFVRFEYSNAVCFVDVEDCVFLIGSDFHCRVVDVVVFEEEKDFEQQ